MIIFYGQNNKLRKHHRLSFSKFNKTIQYVLEIKKGDCHSGNRQSPIQQNQTHALFILEYLFYQFTIMFRDTVKTFPKPLNRCTHTST